MENDTIYGYADYYSYIPVDDESSPQEAVIKFDPIVLSIFIFMFIVVLLSLIGNILVLVILGLYEDLKSLTNCFMFNLALSDLIFTLGIPFWACSYIWSWIFGDFMCRSVNFVFSVGFHSSIVFLMLMSIQCYVAVAHPLSDWTKCHSSAVIPIIAWVLSCSAALPDTLFSEAIKDPTEPDTLYCELNSVKASVSVAYEQNIFLVVAFSVMSFCFKGILLTIFKAQTKKDRTVRLVFCMVVVSFVSWAPYNIVIFLQTLNHHQIEFFTQYSVFAQLNYAFHVCRLLAFSHCCVNPVIYIFASTKIRNHLKALLQKMFQRQTNTEFHQAEIYSDSSL
ncbi:chemokine XC receptor 1-like isoform X2 [Pygocentrus nattereri]|uniref:chemokine XC receptor 1-like isoform X2 n=1 Tax=Pygocentrus nattereri TaxID=42514 RepID=UPI0018917B18|nr:chemokine XC receptor 1-like isoform X2 [Pygocentrus nattereri]XP_037396895.1 chemokine XC receptor 1-like isoform X2 [Pygocentrus nattereri]XP_037396896.1 chemokine XC receptor 1-like isoform X2 [Pygocentrus nattereri]